MERHCNDCQLACSLHWPVAGQQAVALGAVILWRLLLCMITSAWQQQRCTITDMSCNPPTSHVCYTSFTLGGIALYVILRACALAAGTAGGVTLTMATIFLLGILATKAEPALNVLGETVETLSGGKFTKRLLIWAVCVGVAVGMAAGGLHFAAALHLPDCMWQRAA